MKKSIILFLLIFNTIFSLSPDEAIELIKKSTKSQKMIAGEKIPKNQVIASILLCSDMDTKINNIFNITKDKIYTVNVLGNVALEPEIASLEYSAIQLNSPVIVVLGHYHCNIIDDVIKGKINEDTIQSIRETLDSSIERARLIYGTNYSETLYKQSIILNVYYSMENIIKESKIIKNLIQNNQIKVIGAVYNEKTGYIEWLNEHPMQQEIIDETYNSLEFLAFYKDNSNKKNKNISTTTSEKKQNLTETPKKLIVKETKTTTKATTTPKLKDTTFDFILNKNIASPRKPSYITMIINTPKKASKVKLEVFAINVQTDLKNLIFALPEVRIVNGRAQAQFYFAGRKFKKNLYLPKGKYRIVAHYNIFDGNQIVETKTIEMKDIITLY